MSYTSMGMHSHSNNSKGQALPPAMDRLGPWELYCLVLCLFATARVIRVEGASVEEMPPLDPTLKAFS